MKLLFRVLLAFLLLFIIYSSIPQPCFANPINPDFPYRLGVEPFGLWLLSPLVEALFIIIILLKRFTNYKAGIGTFLLIYLLNLITLPITQLLASFIFTSVSHPLSYLAELFPLVVEFYFLKKIFNSLFKHGRIKTPVTVKQTILITLAANALTFILGLLFYRYFPALLNPYHFGTNNYIPQQPGWQPKSP
jgi:hypothetical protein